MNAFLTLLSLILIFVVLADAFETMVLPRRVTRPFRYARLYYRYTWRFWRLFKHAFPAGKRRETFLSFFGPLSLLGLFTSWVVLLVTGFGMLHWALESPLSTSPD